MKTARPWWNPLAALDFLDARVGRFLSTLDLATTVPLGLLLKIVGVTVVAVYATVVAFTLVNLRGESHDAPVFVVTANHVALGAAFLFFGIGAWCAITLAVDLHLCWRRARRSPIGACRDAHISTTPTESIDELRAYAAQRRNEALRDHRIVTDAVKTMAKEIFQ